jgi:hypothetical protein
LKGFKKSNFQYALMRKKFTFLFLISLGGLEKKHSLPPQCCGGVGGVYWFISSPSRELGYDSEAMRIRV